MNGSKLTLNWDDISDDVISYYVRLYQGDEMKTNTYIKPTTPTFSTTFTKDGEYSYHIIAYSKTEKAFLEPVVVNVTVVNKKAVSVDIVK